MYAKGKNEELFMIFMKKKDVEIDEGDDQVWKGK